MGQSYKLFTGQLTGVTTSAVPIAVEPQASIREVLVQSDPANTTNARIGTAAAQYVALTPGQAISFPLNSLTRIYVKMVSGTGVINWVARD